MAEARITSKGQITIPKKVRDLLQISPGDSLDFTVDDGTGELRVRPIHRRRLAEFRGVFKVNAALPFDEERERAWRERANEILEGSESGDA